MAAIQGSGQKLTTSVSRLSMAKTTRMTASGTVRI